MHVHTKGGYIRLGEGRSEEGEEGEEEGKEGFGVDRGPGSWPAAHSINYSKRVEGGRKGE